MGPIVGVVETSNAWCPLEYQTYFVDGTSLFRCAWPFDGNCALIIHWCVVSTKLSPILDNTLGVTYFYPIMHNGLWDGIEAAVDFFVCVQHFNARSALCNCPLVNSVHWNVTHVYMMLQFCLGLYGHLADIYLLVSDSHWWVVRW